MDGWICDSRVPWFLISVAVIFASLAIYIVSKLGAPTAGMVERFDAAEKDYNLNT